MDSPPTGDRPEPHPEGASPALVADAAEKLRTGVALCEASGKAIWWNAAFATLATQEGLTAAELASRAASLSGETLGDDTLSTCAIPHAWRSPTDGAAVNGWVIEARPRERLLAGSRSHELDAVTGVLTRRAIDERLADWFASADRRSFALAFLDADGFKQINDHHGHVEGDRRLKALADALQGGTREGDLVGRFGGDEFVLLLAGVNDAATWRPIEARLRGAVAALPAATDDGDPTKLDLSIGVAYSIDSYASASDLLAAADAAMYTEKRGKQQA